MSSQHQSAASPSDSTTRSQALVAVLPYLRRYARAVSGSLESGDQYLRHFLGVVLSAPDALTADGDTKLRSFTLFQQVCRGLDPAGDTVPAASASWMERQLAFLPSVSREVLLLVYLEGFTIDHAAQIIGLSEPEARAHLLDARSKIKRARRNAHVQRAQEASATYPLAPTLLTQPRTMPQHRFGAAPLKTREPRCAAGATPSPTHHVPAAGNHRPTQRQRA